MPRFMRDTYTCTSIMKQSHPSVLKRLQSVPRQRRLHVGCHQGRVAVRRRGVKVPRTCRGGLGGIPTGHDDSRSRPSSRRAGEASQAPANSLRQLGGCVVAVLATVLVQQWMSSLARSVRSDGIEAGRIHGAGSARVTSGTATRFECLPGARTRFRDLAGLSHPRAS